MSRTARRALAAASVVVAFATVAAPASAELDECIEIVIPGPVITICRPV
jgi:hypothetical protein